MPPAIAADERTLRGAAKDQISSPLAARVAWKVRPSELPTRTRSPESEGEASTQLTSGDPGTDVTLCPNFHRSRPELRSSAYSWPSRVPMKRPSADSAGVELTERRSKPSLRESIRKPSISNFHLSLPVSASTA